MDHDLGVQTGPQMARNLDQMMAGCLGLLKAREMESRWELPMETSKVSCLAQLLEWS
jgi:hypothetical protein